MDKYAFFDERLALTNQKRMFSEITNTFIFVGYTTVPLNHQSLATWNLIVANSFRPFLWFRQTRLTMQRMGSRLSDTLTASHRNLHRQNKPEIPTVMCKVYLYEYIHTNWDPEHRNFDIECAQSIHASGNWWSSFWSYFRQLWIWSAPMG